MHAPPHPSEFAAPVVGLVLRYVLRALAMPFYFAYGASLLLLLAILAAWEPSRVVAMLAMFLFFAPSVIVESGVGAPSGGQFTFEEQDVAFCTGTWFLLLNMLADMVRFMRRSQVKRRLLPGARLHVLVFVACYFLIAVVGALNGIEDIGWVAGVGLAASLATLVGWMLYRIILASAEAGLAYMLRSHVPHGDERLALGPSA